MTLAALAGCVKNPRDADVCRVRQEFGRHVVSDQDLRGSNVSGVDFAYLEAYVGGDAGIAAEVLGLFQSQAEDWRAGLAAPDAGFRDLAHTIKGAAHGIGARALGDAAARAELQGADQAPAVLTSLDAALSEIASYLAAAST